MTGQHTPHAGRPDSGAGGPPGPDRRAVVAVAVVAFAAAAAVSVLLLPFVDMVPAPALALQAPADEAVAYVDPPDPPPALAAQVAAGRALMADASLGRRGLSCSSCHFEGGRTPGGRNGGVSLVGVAAAYPRATEDGEVRTLPDQVNRCLEDSLGAAPLRRRSARMTALTTYLHWQSVGTPLYRPPPWLGLDAVAAPEGPRPAGEALFTRACAPCHGEDGAGTDIAPAVWGPASFGAASPLAGKDRLTSFVAHNMPRENPYLEPGEAVAVSSWLLRRPRPG